MEQTQYPAHPNGDGSASADRPGQLKTFISEHKIQDPPEAAGVMKSPLALVVAARSPAPPLGSELEPFDECRVSHDWDWYWEEEQEVKKLYLEAELLRGWDDPEFQRRYAEAHRNELVANAASIRQEARKRFSSPRVLQYFKKHFPVGYARLRGRLDALAVAEQLPYRAAFLPAMHQLTEEEVRQRTTESHRRYLLRKVARARMEVRIEQKQKRWVARKYRHLPEDERLRIERQIIEPIYEQEDDNGTTL